MRHENAHPDDELTRISTNLAALERTMSELGVSQSELARRAHMPPSAICSALKGREYLGATRRQRLQDALHQIAVEQQAAKRAAEEQ